MFLFVRAVRFITARNEVILFSFLLFFERFVLVLENLLDTECFAQLIGLFSLLFAERFQFAASRIPLVFKFFRLCFQLFNASALFVERGEQVGNLIFHFSVATCDLVVLFVESFLF